MKKGRFVIGNLFLVDPKIEKFFNVVQAKSKTKKEGYTEYVGVSVLFDGVNGDIFKIGYKDGEFKAFELGEVMDGWIYVGQAENNFNSLPVGAVPKAIIKKGELKKDVKKIVTLKTFNFKKLYNFVLDDGFVAKDWGGKGRASVIKYCKSVSITVVDGKLFKPVPEPKEEEKDLVIKSGTGYVLNPETLEMTTDPKEAFLMSLMTVTKITKLMSERGISLEVIKAEDLEGDPIKTYKVIKEDSVKNETGKKFSRIELMQEILRSLEKWYMILGNEGFPPVVARWKELSSTLGRHIRFVDSGGDVEGEAIDLDDYGGLIIRGDDGVMVKKMSGDVIQIR